LQFPERWGDPQIGVAYRQGFATVVKSHADPVADRVVVFEPNPWLADELISLWSWFPNTTVDRRDVSRDTKPNSDQRYFFAREDGSFHRTFSPERTVVERRFPLGTIESQIVQTSTIQDLLSQSADGEQIAMVSIDGRRTSLKELRAVDWSVVDCIAVALTVTGLPSAVHADLKAVFAGAGFHSAGRPWGAAGDTYLLQRPQGFRANAKARVAQAKSSAGAATVFLRDDLAGPSSRLRLRTMAKVAARRLEKGDILNPDHVASVSSVTREEVEFYLDAAAQQSGETWDVSTFDEADVWGRAKECRARHGVWPISFSYPRTALPISVHPTKLISPITPGFPYSFKSESEYVAAYENSYMGITHRKAGWDCFRHLEIMASGAVPLMLDADRIPRFSMVHYPKLAMAQATRLFAAHGGPPSRYTREAFRHHFELHLGSEAMTSYVLEAAGLSEVESVLFVDANLQSQVDYLSVMTLIGLKQVLGKRCHVMFPVDYVYVDTVQETSGLYGRGFGYTRVLAPQDRDERGKDVPLSTLCQNVDAVVVGSITRNTKLAGQIVDFFPADRTIWIHGEDLPPTPEEVSKYRRAQTHVFVRAIHSRD
jgi:hypothetical protein